jgi:amino acid permease
VLFFFILWKVLKREWSLGVSLATVDLDRGRRFRDITRQSVQMEQAARPLWKKIF